MLRGATQRLDMIETINGIVVFLFAGAATLMGALAAMGAHHPLLSLGTLLFGGFAAILVHELGHALAAWLVGWRVWIIHVAPFALRLDDMSVRVVGHYGGPDFAGFVLSSPRTPQLDTKLRNAFVSAGGPIASWLMAGLFIAAALPGPTISYDVSNERYMLYALGLFSLATAIATSLPLSGGDRKNDAAQIHTYLTGTAPRRPHALWAFGLWRHGIEPKHWNAELRASVAAARADPTIVWLPAYFDFIAAIRANNAQAARATFSAFGAEFNDAALDALEVFVRASIDGDTDGTRVLINDATALDRLPTEILHLRELALVDIERVAGEISAARNRLARLHANVARSPHAREPHWSELFAAANARFKSP
jgi:hypothetical protein